MSQQVDSSLNVPAPIPSVRALQANPEVLTPVRHGFLWKRSRLFKTWISRWFQLDTNGFLYAVSPKVIKRDGRSVLPSAVREVLPLPPQRYRNGATMYGIRVVSVGGRVKDLYTDDCVALDAWALDLARSTPAARKAAAAAAVAAAAAAAAAQPPLVLLPPQAAHAAAAAAGGGGGLQLADICEVDWSGMLGSGLFACVLRGRMHMTGEAVAVKIIKAEAYREYGDIVEREAAVWAAAGQHPHVAALKQTLRSAERVYFIAELCEGGGLIERLAASATYCEREVAWLARQLLAAVQHLHDNAIVHMDIKPENLVFASRRDDSCIKLIDFSLASFFYSPTDPGGTPDFVAPELLNQPEHYAKTGCGPEVDMWAVGVMVFFLLSGQTPFQAPTLEGVLQRVKTGEWAFHGRRWALVSEGARDLVSSLLCLDPAQRLSAAEALDHPWLRRPDSLSQALLQDAVTAFRLAATAVVQQQRTSWVKQASGDLMTTTGTNATNLSPHTSLSRFAVMAASMGTAAGVGGGGMGLAGMSTAGMGAALLTGGGQSLVGLMSTGAADAVAAMIGPSGAGASSAVMMTSSSASQHQLAHAVGAGGGFGFGGGHSGRGSLPSGQRSSSAAAAAAAAAAGGGALAPGSSPPSRPSPVGSYQHHHNPQHQLQSQQQHIGGVPHQHSFSAGVGARYAAAVAMAPHCSGAGSPPRLPSGNMATAAVTSAVARISPHNSHHSPGSTGRSPRSPLGMRTRRASDTMAYTLAITERQESLKQMQAQGLPVPPVASCIAWPGLGSAKARRTSELLPLYGITDASCVAPSPSDSQAELAAASAAVAVASASVDRGNHSAPGTRCLHHLHGHGQHHPAHYGHPAPPLRGASGLSVMTSAAGVSSGRIDGRPTGGRSNPELFSMLRMQSSNGGRSGVSSCTEVTPHTSSRDGGGGGAGRNSWASLSAQVMGPPQVKARQPQGQQPQGQGQPTGASLPPADLALLALSKGLKQGVPGKSQSYNVMPAIWLDRPGGRGVSSGQGLGAIAPAAAASGGGTGSGVVAVQRRASMSFTLGAPVTGLSLMPHGPSPLSNSSGGRNLIVDSNAAGASGANAAGAAASGGAAAVTPSGGSGWPLPALLLLRRPSRGNSGGGNFGVRSAGSTSAHASPTNSNTNLQPHTYGALAAATTAAGGCGFGGGGSVSSPAAGSGSAFASASSMYAAVLRSNLSGQGASASGPGGGAARDGGAAGFDCGGGAGGGVRVDSGRRRRQASGSGSNASGVQDAPTGSASAASSSVLCQPGANAGPESSPPSPATAAAAAAAADAAVGGGGSSSNSDAFLIVGGVGVGSGTQLWEARQASDPAVQLPLPAPASSAAAAPPPRPPPAAVGQALHDDFPGVMYSSSTNVMSGCNLLASDRCTTQGSFIEATLMTATHVHGSMAAPGRGGGSELSSGPHSRTPGSIMDSNGAARGIAAFDDRRLQPPPASTMAMLRGAGPESDHEMFSIGLNVVCDAEGGSGGGYGSGSNVAAAAMAVGLQPGWTQPRSDFQHPELTRSKSGVGGDGSPRGESKMGGGGGGDPSRGGSPRRAVSAAASTPSAQAPAELAAVAAAAGVDPFRGSGIAQRASSRLVLETIPSEDPDSLSGLLRSVREERAATGAAAAAAAASGGGGEGATSSVGAASFSSGPSGVGSALAKLFSSPSRRAVQQPQQQQQQPPFVMAPSPLSRQAARAFLSPQASSTSLGPASLLPSSKSVIEPGLSGGCDSGGSGGVEEQQSRLRVSGTGDIPATVAAPADVGSNSVRSTGSIRSSSIRRSATVNNLRLHATTAAAAQAAAAAAAAAADAAQPSPLPTEPAALEPDPFAAWNYPPPSAAQVRHRAASAVGLSGPSLAALLAQAAPLAQAAQAFAAAQIAHSQSSSIGSSFTSLRGGLGGGSGNIRAAGATAMAIAMASGTGGVDGTFHGLGHSAGSLPLASTHSDFDAAHAGGSVSPCSAVRRSSTTANLNISQQLQLAAAAAPPPQQQLHMSVGSGRDTGSGSPSSSTRLQLAGLLAQAAPLAQAAQASAAAQAAAAAALRAPSNTSATSTSSANAAAAAVLICAGDAAAGGGGVGTYGRGAGSGAATPQSYGSESLASSTAWARRATTSNDLRDRALAVQISGSSMMHRLASQQGPGVGSGGGSVYSSSPPREPGSPISVSPRTSTFPAVPSRLSNSGSGTPTGRAAPSPVLSPQSSSGAGGGGGGAGPPQRTPLAGGGGTAASGSMSLPPQLQLQPSAPSATYHLQLQQIHQLQQLQQLQQIHNMQQLRHQQMKGANAAAAAGGSVSASGSGRGLAGAAPQAGRSQGATSGSASLGTLDSATQAAIMQDALRSGIGGVSCNQLPLPQLYE